MPAESFTILIADDNPNNLFTLEALINAHMTARILRAEHGEEVLGVLLKEKVDLIILDVQMPRMDGFECAQLIRMRPADKDIPILFLTASMRSEEARSKGLDLGAVDYLRKPIDDRVLINKINGFRQLVTRERQEQQVLHQRVEQTSKKLARAEELTVDVVGSMLRGLAVFQGESVLLVNPALERLMAQVEPIDPTAGSGVILHALGCNADEKAAVFEGRGFIKREYAWEPTRVGNLASWLQVSALPLKEEQVMLVVEDITEQKIYEQTLRDALDAAEAASRAKTEFLGNMSHEVRTPLNGILGIAQLLRRGEVLPAQERYLRLLQESGTRLLRIVNDVLDFSRVEAGHIELSEEPFDLWQLVTDMVDLHQPEAANSDIELVTLLDPAPSLSLIGDEQRLSQIILNLLSNAMKFTEGGRVQVGLRVIEALEDSVALRLSVSDTGIGMDDAQLETLFQRFAQGDASRTKTYGGTGLGLAICKALAEAMGGTITVDSKVGKGSTFSLDLRLPSTATEALGKAAEPAPSGDWRGSRVLVAEDDPVNRMVVQAMLESLGCFPVLAEHGEEAVECAEKGRFDLILMDLHMPHLDGLQAAAAIRATSDPTPIIALTANILPKTPKECLASGMNGYLSKPTTIEDIERCLGAWVDQHPAEQELPDATSDQAAAAQQTQEVFHLRTGSRPLDAHDDLLDDDFLQQQKNLLGPAFKAMIEAYLRGMDEGIGMMRSAVTSGEMVDLRAHAHKAKSSSLQLGAAGLVERCNELEYASGEGVVEASLGAQIDLIERLFNRLRHRFEQLAK
jgi:signal transduction histidine kinase/HPt (histidine-containing phosphotransfer) domain-containing protein